jgi:hypothetical protein
MYGAGQTWSAPMQVNGSVACNNAVFGDPLVTVSKECLCQSPPAVCSLDIVTSMVTAFVVGRNATCAATIAAVVNGSTAWDAMSNCPCYLLVPQENASQLTCLPTPTAQQTLWADWQQCEADGSGPVPADPNSSHVVECGSGNPAQCVRNSLGSTGSVAPDPELHEVRCCSDVLISGWTKRRGCAVWSESDAWPQGCSTLNWPSADALCRSTGGRLCTASEVTSSCARGTGCGNDADMVWTSSTVCTPQAINYMTQTYIAGRGTIASQCVANITALLISGQPNAQWSYLSNCQCYMLIPQYAAANFTCIPFASANESIYDEWQQCAALATTTAGTPVNPNQCHIVECGNGAQTCANGQASGRCAPKVELHEVRCCSDTAIAGWTQRPGCTVWSESDAWTQGCQVLNYPTASAFCQLQVNNTHSIHPSPSL